VGLGKMSSGMGRVDNPAILRAPPQRFLLSSAVFNNSPQRKEGTQSLKEWNFYKTRIPIIINFHKKVDTN
jgi:hypothetical protein